MAADKKITIKPNFERNKLSNENLNAMPPIALLDVFRPPGRVHRRSGGDRHRRGVHSTQKCRRPSGLSPGKVIDDLLT